MRGGGESFGGESFGWESLRRLSEKDSVVAGVGADELGKQKSERGVKGPGMGADLRREVKSGRSRLRQGLKGSGGVEE